MSVSYSDCFNDLLCQEDSSGFLSGESPEYSSDLEPPAYFDESVAELIEDEKDFVPGFDYLARFRSQSLDAAAREESVAWILKVHTHYGFQPLTAYLSVNYLDRFLCRRSLPQTDGWPMQLLSVACLSLAAKMEEPLVPSLLDLQVGGAKYIFEPKTVRRMELLVLSVLDWRLRSVTPFSFIDSFASKIDSSGSCIGHLISRSADILLSDIQEARLLEYRPSCIAAAAVLCAASEIPGLSLLNPENAESWCDGLSKEKISGCYRLMTLNNRRIRKAPKVLPQFRVTIRTRMRSSDSSSYSSSSSSSSSSTSSPSKRRKLNNSSWVDDDKESSEPGETQ